MASTASDLLKLELQADGENAGTWGTKANVLFERMEEAITELLAITTTGGTYTLDDTQYVKNSGTTGESHVAMIKVTGVLSSNSSVVCPDRNKKYLVWNATTGSYTMTVKTSAGTGVTIPQGALQEVFCDGTNVEARGVAVDTDGTIWGGPTIKDSNGNEVLIFGETASAVNEVTITNAATGNAPQIAPSGETNVDLKLTTKGTGTLDLETASGGNINLSPNGDGVVSVTGASRGNHTALTSGANISVDFADGNDFTVTLAHNATFDNPSNIAVGQSGSFFITQDGTGSRTGSWGSYYDWVGGTAPTLTTTAAAVDRVDYTVASATSIHCVASLDVK